MTSEIKSQAAKNAQTIAAVKKAADTAKDTAVKHALAKAKAEYDLMWQEAGRPT